MYQNANNTRPEPRMVRSRSHSDPYCVTHNFAGTATLSETVLHAVSGAANVDVRKVEQAMEGRLDTKALDSIFRPGQPSAQPAGHLSISVLGYDVTIYTNGRIVISPQAEY
jgi:hypothetical protein